jgi:beta-phosphoglucomutase family hydrolase/Cof subfamily protein (haloacid dehalogenase superfamily)
LKLLLADVDGTLVTKAKVLTERARDAVARLHDAGIVFAITSGRPPRGLAMLVKPLRLTTPVAAFNGGLLVAPDLRTVVQEHRIPRSLADDVVERLLAYGLDAWVYCGSDWFVRRRDAPHVAREESTVRFGPTLVRDLHEVTGAAVKIVGVSDDFPLVARVETELRELLGERASAARSQPHYLDVTHPLANKGAVVRELSQRLACPLESIAAIGDMPTDVLMFALAGTSIAMGNASPEVQSCARFVTSSNEDEGFARAVERFVLRASSPAVSLGLPESTRACLFDLDGVLTRTAKTHAASWKQAFDELLRARSGEGWKPFDVVHEYAAFVDGKSRLDGVRSFLAERGISLPEGTDADAPGLGTVHALARRKNEIFLEKLRERPVETYQGSLEYLRAVRTAGLKTAVVTSSKNGREVLASAGISDLFDVRMDGVLAAERHLAGKPAPDTYLAASRALGVEPGEAAVFEDALSGVEAGRNGHFGFVVGVDRADQEQELRRHGADVVVRDLATLRTTLPAPLRAAA